MGQNMASGWSYDARDIVCKTIEDGKPKGQSKLLYTDGVGMISENLISRIAIEQDIEDLCAIQVRYKGAKGMLAVSPLL